MIIILLPHCSYPNGLVTSNMAPAHPHTTGVAVDPAVFLNVTYIPVYLRSVIDTMGMQSSYYRLILTIVVLNNIQLQSLYVYERASKKTLQLNYLFSERNSIFSATPLPIELKFYTNKQLKKCCRMSPISTL